MSEMKNKVIKINISGTSFNNQLQFISYKYKIPVYAWKERKK